MRVGGKRCTSCHAKPKRNDFWSQWWTGGDSDKNLHPTRKEEGIENSGINFPGTWSGCPKTNSAGEASRSSFGGKRNPSITQSKRSTKLPSESTERNAAMSDLWKWTHKPLTWGWYTVVWRTGVPKDFASDDQIWGPVSEVILERKPNAHHKLNEMCKPHPLTSSTMSVDVADSNKHLDLFRSLDQLWPPGDLSHHCEQVCKTLGRDKGPTMSTCTWSKHGGIYKQFNGPLGVLVHFIRLTSQISSHPFPWQTWTQPASLMPVILSIRP